MLCWRKVRSLFYSLYIYSFTFTGTTYETEAFPLHFISLPFRPFLFVLIALVIIARTEQHWHKGAHYFLFFFLLIDTSLQVTHDKTRSSCHFNSTRRIRPRLQHWSDRLVEEGNVLLQRKERLGEWVQSLRKLLGTISMRS